MKLLTRAAAATLLLALAAPVPATAHGDEENSTLYVAINPLAAYIGLVGGWPRYGYPFITGHEYGLALSAGITISDHWILEGRLSLGEPHAASFYTQFHLGAVFFVLEYFAVTVRGLYAGGFLKFADEFYRPSPAHFFNLLPYVVVGYWLALDDFFIDLRIEQTFWVLTFSTAPHTGVGFGPLLSTVPGISPIIPAMVINVGFVFD